MNMVLSSTTPLFNLQAYSIPARLLASMLWPAPGMAPMVSASASLQACMASGRQWLPFADAGRAAASSTCHSYAQSALGHHHSAGAVCQRRACWARCWTPLFIAIAANAHELPSRLHAKTLHLLL